MNPPESTPHINPPPNPNQPSHARRLAIQIAGVFAQLGVQELCIEDENGTQHRLAARSTDLPGRLLQSGHTVRLTSNSPPLELVFRPLVPHVQWTPESRTLIGNDWKEESL